MCGRLLRSSQLSNNIFTNIHGITMKVHKFVRDTVSMQSNEAQSLKAREKALKEKTSETNEKKSTRKKKKEEEV